MKKKMNLFSKKMPSYFSANFLLFFWYHHYRKFFLLLSLMVIFLGGWSYYFYVFRYHFTEEEKKQYIESYFEETIFQEKKFSLLIESLEGRKDMHQNTPSINHNIFLER